MNSWRETVSWGKGLGMEPGGALAANSWRETVGLGNSWRENRGLAWHLARAWRNSWARAWREPGSLGNNSWRQNPGSLA